MFYLLPLDQIEDHRGPAYLKWRYRAGLDCRWSLKDFGNNPLGLVASDAPIPQGLEIADWTAKARRDIGVLLRNSGVESDWVLKADNYREALQRLAGLTQAYQANDDNPAAWLGQDIYFGFTALRAIEPMQVRAQKAVDRPIASDNFGPSFNWRGLVASLPFLLFAALPATDAFTAANGTALTVYSANWSNVQGAFAINTNAVHCNDSSDSSARWNADTFNNDQYSQATVAAITSGTYIGVSVRNSNSAANWYTFVGDGGDGSYLEKHAPGTTQLGSKGAVFSTTQVVRLEASGSTITPKINAVTLNPPGAQTDSTYASGYAGVSGAGTSTGSRVDSWEGGNLAGAGVTYSQLERDIGRGVGRGIGLGI